MTRALLIALLLAGCAAFDPIPPAVTAPDPVPVIAVPEPATKHVPPAPPVSLAPPLLSNGPKCARCWTLTITAINGQTSTRGGMTRKECEHDRLAALAKSGRLEASGLTIQQASDNVASAECS